MNKNKNIYLAITIDTECDKGINWKVKYPLRFDAVIKAIPNFFDPLFSELNVKPTYLLSPEVIENDECVEVLKNAITKGGELGTHLHAEFIEPQSDYKAIKTEMRQNSLDPVLEFQKLENITKLFVEKFKFQPKSFRAGRFSISKHTLKFLEQLGYETDSSVVPNKFRRDVDGFVGHDFLGSLRTPYFPSAVNPIQKGNLKLLEIPVASNFNMMDSLPLFLKRLSVKRNKMVYALKYPFKNSFKTKLLRPTGKVNLKEQYKIIDDYVNKNDDVFLVMMFHNVDFIPNCSPYAKSIEDQNRFKDNLIKIVEKIKSYGGAVVTLSEMNKIYKSKRQNHG